MTKHSDKTELCRYHYDPLDRQCGCTIVLQPAHQRFHCKSRLVTEIQGTARWSLFQHDDQLLAQRNHVGANATTLLLASDQQRSVLNALDAARLHPLAYSPYGHRAAQSGLLSLLGFNGERADPVTGHYHLGNGYRQFDPLLMRFNSPDGWSPFGEGGLNAYGYCEGDPVNRSDPTGHRSNVVMRLLKGIANKFGRTPSKLRPAKVKNPVTATTASIDSMPPPQSAPVHHHSQPTVLEHLKKQAETDRRKFRSTDFTGRQTSPKPGTSRAVGAVNYSKEPDSTLQLPAFVKGNKTDSEKLASLTATRDRIFSRLVTDRDEINIQRRQVLLNQVNKDITKLTTQVTDIRSGQSVRI